LISIYLLTAIGLTPGGSSTVHIYTQTIHKKTHIHRTTQTHFIGVHMLVCYTSVNMKYMLGCEERHTTRKKGKKK